MSRLLIIDCIPPGSAGAFSEFGLPAMWVLEQRMLALLDPAMDTDVVFAADVDAPLPDRLAIAGYHGALWTGTPLSFTRDDPAIRRQIELMRQCFAAGVPILGICGGLQAAAVVAGGRVERNPAGLESPVARDVELTEAGRTHPMFRDRGARFDALCDHDDAVTRVPDGATVLASNASCEVQALVLPTNGSEFWGVQYHPDFRINHLEAVAGYRGEQWIELGWLEDQAHLDYLKRTYRRLRHGDSSAAWAAGISNDILDDDSRIAEVAAWLEVKVRAISA